MKKIVLVLFICLIATHALHAQDIQPDAVHLPKSRHQVDVGLGAGSSGFSTALSWSHLHRLGNKQRFHIGYGIRYTGIFGSNRSYTTAPAHLISGGEVNLDTLSIPAVQIHAINAAIHIQYAFSPKWEVGFNIDVAGLSLGASQQGRLQALSRGLPVSEEETRPTSPNLLLVGNNDIGNLNSEFYLRYWLSPRWAIRGGFTYIFTEYTTTRKVVPDNDRFRAKLQQPFLAISFSPFY